MALFIRQQMPACHEGRKKRSRMHYYLPYRRSMDQVLVLTPSFTHFYGWIVARNRDGYDLLMRGA